MELILFAFGISVFFIIPGSVIVDRIGVSLSGLSRLNISIIIGIVSSSIIYKLFSYLDYPELMIIYLALAFVAFAIDYYRKTDKFHIQLPDVATFTVYLLFLILIVYTVFQYTQIPYYSMNLITSGDGLITVVRNKDALLHLSLVNEVARNIPPSTPFISGIELKYHYGMDLLSALFVKYLGFSAADSALRYMPIFSMSLALLSIFTLVKEIGGTIFSALIISFLVIWVDDFSYLFNQMAVSGEGFSGMKEKLYYTPPSFFSLFYINPMIYGVSFLFSGFFLINKYFKTDDKAYLILSVIVICFSGYFKVFITLQILAALAMLVGWEMYKDWRRIVKNKVFRLFVATLILFMVMYAPNIIDSVRGNSLIAMKLALFTDYIPDTIKDLGLTRVSPVDSLYKIYLSKSAGVMSAIYLVFAAVIYTLFSFSLRCLSVPYMYSEMRSGENTALILAVLFVAIGPFLTLFMSVKPLHASSGYNNSIWFLVQSKYLAWIFLYIPLSKLFTLKDPNKRNSIIKIIVISAFVFLVIYSVKGNYLLLDYYKNDQKHKPVFLDKKYTRLLDSFKEPCGNGEIFISDDYWVNYVLVGSGCRTVLFASWGGTFVSINEGQKRYADLKRFWRGYYNDKVNYDMLDKYNVRYVINRKTLEVVRNHWR